MSVIINMACGLANRMFQYSYYLFLKRKGFDVSIDYYNKSTLAHEDVAWERIFPKANYECADPKMVKRLGGGPSLFCKIRRKLPGLHKTIEANGAYDVPIPPKNKSRYILGVFQNAQMIETVKEEVLKTFVFPSIEGEHNNQISEEINQSESVAIHVRKGKDYQQRIWYQNTCPVEYYENAVKCLKTILSNPRFYVFTDNPSWVKENFKNFDYQLVEGNPGAGWGSHFDMQLMSMCKHNIISNSTYAWWGAYLNKNPGKRVIIPKIWFNPESDCPEYTSKPLCCEGWEMI